MALYPYSHSPFDIFEDPFLHHGMEPRFGMGISPSDFHSGLIIPRVRDHHLPTGYRRPWAIARQAVHEIAENKRNQLFGKDGFQACVDVHHFQPSEISVKTHDQTIVIEGKHEERNDTHGSVERHFVRKYVLPKEYDMNSIQSSLSSDGVLTVKAPLPAIKKSGEREIPIMHSNIPVQMSLKDNKPEGKEKDGGH